MPTMSRREAAFCRSTIWGAFARRVVLPWALQGVRPEGQILEIGAGGGVMAVELLAANPDVSMVVTDFDDAMVAAATTRLASFAHRADARRADATVLPFADDSFDMVLSWIMLHHTLAWETALAEAIRVVRPGGHVVGYDLLDTAPLRLLHQAEGSAVRMMRFDELRSVARRLPAEQVILTSSLGGLAVRFLLRKQTPGRAETSRAADTPGR